MTMFKYEQNKVLNRQWELCSYKCLETSVHENENTPLKSDVILFQMTVLHCPLTNLKIASISVLEIPVVQNYNLCSTF